MNILEQLNDKFKKEFSDMGQEAKPVSLEEIELMNQAKLDFYAGKTPQSNHPAYIEAFSIESSLHIKRSAS